MDAKSATFLLAFVACMMISFVERQKGNYMEAYWWLGATAILCIK